MQRTAVVLALWAVTVGLAGVAPAVAQPAGTLVVQCTKDPGPVVWLAIGDCSPEGTVELEG